MESTVIISLTDVETREKHWFPILIGRDRPNQPPF